MKAGTARANRGGYAGALPARTSRETHGDSGAVSRFFPAHEWGRYDVDPLELLPFMYEGKARGKARLDGAEGVNPHPTVKPVALIRWLWRLVAGPGVLGLDPFLGSGSHAVAALLEGLRVHGIEREAEYVELARRRLLALPSGGGGAPR
jgi:site-specific DNA-methyltransferase (adenine-specific)